VATPDYDDYYVPNRACHCLRCSLRSLMGPAVLITVGVLFLLQQLHIFQFGRTFPVLLIVIGLVKIAQRSAPDTGHIQPPPYYPPGMAVPPPPAPAGGSRPDSEVNRG
jgi:cell wall-active antibiotic response 4TMS protein YvqF